jgi:hypothetical protein
MSLEGVEYVATLGTFLVIAATALVAIVQLHRMRAGNPHGILHARHAKAVYEF